MFDKTKEEKDHFGLYQCWIMSRYFSGLTDKKSYGDFCILKPMN